MRSWFPLLLLALGLGIPFPAAAGPAGTVTLVFYEDYPPFSYREGGTLKGLYVDLVKELFEKRLNLRVEAAGYPWARAQQLVREGLADGFVTAPTDERRTYTEITQPALFQFSGNLYTGASHPDRDRVFASRTLEDLRQWEIASYVGNGWVKQNLKEAQITWASTMADLLSMLQSRRPFVTLETGPVMDWLIRTNRLEGKILKGPPLVTSSVHLCVGKGSVYAADLARINQALKEFVASDRYQAIVAPYR